MIQLLNLPIDVIREILIKFIDNNESTKMIIEGIGSKYLTSISKTIHVTISQLFVDIQNNKAFELIEECRKNENYKPFHKKYSDDDFNYADIHGNTPLMLVCRYSLML